MQSGGGTRFGREGSSGESTGFPLLCGAGLGELWVLRLEAWAREATAEARARQAEGRHPRKAHGRGLKSLSPPAVFRSAAPSAVWRSPGLLSDGCHLLGLYRASVTLSAVQRINQENRSKGPPPRECPLPQVGPPFSVSPCLCLCLLAVILQRGGSRHLGSSSDENTLGTLTLLV